MRAPHRRVGRQLTLDLAGFDAEATDLHLAVKPADEGDESVGIGARKVTGSIEPFAAAVVPRQRDELTRSLVRKVLIAGRDAVACQQQFTDLVHRRDTFVTRHHEQCFRSR